MNLKKIRLKNNLTQEEVAKICNISLVAYNKYENNIRTPQLPTLIKLADYFDVSLDYLCNRQWNNNVGYIPEDKRELVKLFLELDDIDTQKSLAYITALKDAKK